MPEIASPTLHIGPLVATTGTFSGAVSTAALSASGNFAVATNKFTVAAASGNTVIAGTAAITGAVTLSSTLAGKSAEFTTNQNATTTVGVTNTDATNGDSRSRFLATAATVIGTVTSIGAGASAGVYIGSNSNHDVNLIANGTNYATVKSTGQVLIGTTVTAGAAAGDLILANGKKLRFVDAAGTGTRIIANTDASNNVIFGDADSAMYLKYQDPTLGAIERRVSVGAVDSGGAGYRLLRLPNA